MLSRIRRKLRLIEYHSAARPRTAWTQLLDVALFATLLLALPATWLADLVVYRSEVTTELTGYFGKLPAGEITATLLLPDRMTTVPSDATPIGAFKLPVEHRHQGWPLTTSIARQPARLEIDLRSASAPQKGVKLMADDPLRAALEQALRDGQQHDALAAILREAPLVQRHWLGVAASAGIWWIILMFASWVGINCAKLVTLIGRDKIAQQQRRRRAKGQCVACGYNLTGLEFSERCPECGELSW